MRITNVRVLASALAALFVGSCAPAALAGCDRPVSRDGRHGIRVCSPMTADLVAEVRAVLKPGDRYAVITSEGGDPRAAITLIETLNAAKVQVRLRDFCASACAHYVLLGADSVRVEPRTVVAFHHTSTLIDGLLKASGMTSPPSLGAKAAEEQAFFKRRGLPLRALEEPGERTGPRCYFTAADVGRDQAEVWMEHQFIVPHRAWIEQVRGRPIEGYWQNTPEQLQRDMQRLSLKLPGTVVFSGARQLSSVRKSWSIPRCQSIGIRAEPFRS